MCGNGTCDAGESNATCPGDCPPVAAMCGDGTCNGTEDSTTCPGDCPPASGIDCNDQNVLLSCILCLGGLGCTGVTEADCNTCLGGGGACNLDGVCDAGEDPATCPDCP